MAPDLAIASEDDSVPDDPDSPKSSFWERIAASQLPTKTPNREDPIGLAKGGRATSFGHTKTSSLTQALSRPTGQDTRSATTPPRRLSSETRDRLRPFEAGNSERRRNSLARRRALSARRSSAHKLPVPRRSAPEMRKTAAAPLETQIGQTELPHVHLPKFSLDDRLAKPSAVLPDVAPPLISPRSSLDDERLSRHSSHSSDGLNDPAFWQELEARWILNLSMAFRDSSEREKFFITYAEERNRWRRVTVSIDYRNKPPDSLEADLKTLPFQRDKSAHIYEAIHESLPKVQFFDSVTNLKLETSDGRLHVHVTKDENEIIKYPSVDAIGHLEHCPEVVESDINFESHLSGFVYKVSVKGQTYIKKEIPGPDMIDEFLYEVNALWNLKDSPHVIEFCAIVLDDERTCIKGLLISYADRGTLVDIIYDNRDPPLPWSQRDRWARQIVAGLADIHEHGFVQGDFTLSNIVIDSNDDARIIDINRRGCPVGWEPPEFQGLINSGQRISMYIGAKSDLYQLGMVLWALAELDDEPERAIETPLTLQNTQSGAPAYWIKWVASCLADRPVNRLSASEMLAQLTRHKPGANRRVASGQRTRSDARPTEEMGRDHPHRNDGDDRALSSQFAVRSKAPGSEEPGNSATRQDSFRMQPPPHQDSGLPGSEEEITRFGPLPHQDSGLGESFCQDDTEGSDVSADTLHGRGAIRFMGGQFG